MKYSGFYCCLYLTYFFLPFAHDWKDPLTLLFASPRQRIGRAPLSAFELSASKTEQFETEKGDAWGYVS